MESRSSRNKRAATTAAHLKQMRLNNMKKNRKEQRERQIRNSRDSINVNNLQDSERPNTVSMNNDPADNENVQPVKNDDSKKKKQNKALQKWQEEKQKHKEAAKRKLGKPVFSVSAHYKSTPACALPAVVRNSTYQNISPRVSTRNLNSTYLVMTSSVPAKFNFRGRCKTPAVFEFVASPVPNVYY